MIQTTERPALKLWVKSVEHFNDPYWRRRGFKDVEAKSEPAGEVGCYEGVCSCYDDERS